MAGLLPAAPLAPAALVPPLAAAGACVAVVPDAPDARVPDVPAAAVAARPEAPADGAAAAPPVLGVTVDVAVDMPVAPAEESAGGALLQPDPSNINNTGTRQPVSIRLSIAVTIQRIARRDPANQAL
jgi:hypothetical protein